MKPFHELTDEEVLNLSEAEVERYVDLACAEEGVPFMPPLPVAPEPYEGKGSTTIYLVGGQEFTDKAEAESIANVINAAASRIDTTSKYPQGNYRGSSVYVIDAARELGSVEVSTRTVFSMAEYEAHRAGLAEYQAARDAYNKAKSLYDDISGRRFEAREPIATRLADVRAEAARRKRMVEGFEPYVELADGDRTVAMRFYRRAEFIPEDIVEQLVPGFFGTPEALDEKAAPAPEEEVED